MHILFDVNAFVFGFQYIHQSLDLIERVFLYFLLINLWQAFEQSFDFINFLIDHFIYFSF